MFKPSEREEEQSIRRGDLIAFTPVLDGPRLRRGGFWLLGGFFSFARSWGGGFYSRLGRFFNGVAPLTPYRTGRYVRLGAPRCGSRARPCALWRRYASRVIARGLYRPLAGFGRPGRAAAVSDQRERFVQSRAAARNGSRAVAGRRLFFAARLFALLFFLPIKKTRRSRFRRVLFFRLGKAFADRRPLTFRAS